MTRHGLDEAVKEQLVNLLLTASGRPQDLEFHSLRAADLEAWQHPLPFDFHFSEGWRERFRAGEWLTLNDGTGHDVDLAAHLTILRERGIALPAEYRSLAPHAVGAYRGDARPSFDRTLLERFAGHVNAEVKELASRAS